MPRIDPSQLLNTLSVLLAPNGGIRSAGEVRKRNISRSDSFKICKQSSGSKNCPAHAEVLKETGVQVYLCSHLVFKFPRFTGGLPESERLGFA